MEKEDERPQSQATGGMSKETEEFQKYADTGEKNAVIRLMNSKHTDINSPNRDGKTPLHMAALHGHIDVIEVLLAKDAKSGQEIRVNQEDRDGNLPLHLAAKENHLEAVKMLVDGGNANVNARNKLGETPLLLAARAGHIAVVNYFLLQRISAEINTACCDQWTPLHSAVYAGHDEVVASLTRQRHLVVNTFDVHKMSSPLIASVELCGKLPAPNSPDNTGRSNCSSVIEKRDVARKIMTSLLVRGADVRSIDSNGQTALHRAAKYCRKDIVELLLNPKYIVEKTAYHGSTHTTRGSVVDNPVLHIHDADGRTPLHVATAHNSVAIIPLLVKKSRSVDQNGDTALHLACRLGFREAVEILPGNWLANKEGLTALDVAVESDRYDIAEYLLTSQRTKDAVLAPATTDENGDRMGVARHPLLTAAELGLVEMTQLLLRIISDAWAVVDMHLRTALHVAAYFGHKRIVELLLEAGFHVNQGDDRDQTPIHSAARAGHPDVIETLLVAGGEINERDIKGRTALFIAAKAGHGKAVKFLLLKQARFDIPNIKNVSPYLVAYEMKSSNACAREADYLEVLMLLTREGAADERKLLPQYRVLKLDKFLNKLISVGSVAFSYVDVITDVTSLLIYYQSGNMAYFAMGLSFMLIPSSMVMALQHTHVDRMLALLQLLLLKEFFVSYFYKREETPVLSTLKIIESVAEACPSALLQVYILLDFILRPGAPTHLGGLGIANSIILFSLCMSVFSTAATLSNAVVLPEETETTFTGYSVKCLCMSCCDANSNNPYVSARGSGSSRLRIAEQEGNKPLSILVSSLFRMYAMTLHFFEISFRLLAMSSIFLAVGRYALPMLLVDFMLRYAIVRYITEAETTKSWSDFVKFCCRVLLSLATDCIWIENRLATFFLCVLTIGEGVFCASTALYFSAYTKDNYDRDRIVAMIYVGICALTVKMLLLGSRYLSVYFMKIRAARVAPEPRSMSKLGIRKKRRLSVTIPGTERVIDSSSCMDALCCSSV